MCHTNSEVRGSLFLGDTDTAHSRLVSAYNIISSGPLWRTTRRICKGFSAEGVAEFVGAYSRQLIHRHHPAATRSYRATAARQQSAVIELIRKGAAPVRRVTSEPRVPTTLPFDLFGSGRKGPQEAYIGPQKLHKRLEKA